MLLEVCCDTFESALNAEMAAADRIEFCTDLSTGGLSPSIALVTKIKEKLQIPINVLIRPRQGNFVYSDDEFQVMLHEIELFKKINIDGIVCGMLTKEGEIDIFRTKLLLERIFPLPFTFHRAIDNVKDYFAELKNLVNIGVAKVLTSGGYNSVDDGFLNIKKAHKEFGNKITIMPGGGVNINNILKFKKIGIREIHSSASKLVIDNNYLNPLLLGMGNCIENNNAYYKTADINKIKELVKLININNL